MEQLNKAIANNKKELDPKEYEEYVALQVAGYVEGREKAKKPLMREVIKTFLEGFDFRFDERILDVGCGTGTLLEVFSELGYDSLCGIDINPKKVSLARKNDNTCIHQADFTDIPFLGDGFSLITSFHTIEHCWNIDAVLKEVSRVLCDGGLFFCIVPDEPKNTNPKGKGNAHTHPFTSEEQVREEFGRHFKVLEVSKHSMFEKEFFVICRNK